MAFSLHACTRSSPVQQREQGTSPLRSSSALLAVWHTSIPQAFSTGSSIPPCHAPQPAHAQGAQLGAAEGARDQLCRARLHFSLPGTPSVFVQERASISELSVCPCAGRAAQCSIGSQGPALCRARLHFSLPGKSAHHNHVCAGLAILVRTLSMHMRRGRSSVQLREQGTSPLQRPGPRPGTGLATTPSCCSSPRCALKEAVRQLTVRRMECNQPMLS